MENVIEKEKKDNKKDENVLTDEDEREEINVNLSEDEYVSRETLLLKIEKLEMLTKRADQRIKRHKKALEVLDEAKHKDEEKARQALLKMGINMLMGKRG
jgi:hypothetical protein